MHLDRETYMGLAIRNQRPGTRVQWQSAMRPGVRPPYSTDMQWAGSVKGRWVCEAAGARFSSGFSAHAGSESTLEPQAQIHPPPADQVRSYTAPGCCVTRSRATCACPPRTRPLARAPTTRTHVVPSAVVIARCSEEQAVRCLHEPEALGLSPASLGIRPRRRGPPKAAEPHPDAPARFSLPESPVTCPHRPRRGARPGPRTSQRGTGLWSVRTG